MNNITENIKDIGVFLRTNDEFTRLFVEIYDGETLVWSYSEYCDIQKNIETIGETGASETIKFAMSYPHMYTDHNFPKSDVDENGDVVYYGEHGVLISSNSDRLVNAPLSDAINRILKTAIVFLAGLGFAMFALNLV